MKNKPETHFDPVTFSSEECDILKEINKKLAAIESLLQRLPEIQAAVFFQMLDEYQDAKLIGQKAGDLWEVIPPSQR